MSEETFSVTDKAWRVNELARKMMDASPEALEVIGAVLSGGCFEQIYGGKNVDVYEVTVPKPDTCPDCGGSGKGAFVEVVTNSGVICPTCHGDGVSTTLYYEGINPVCPPCKGTGKVEGEGE